MSYAIPVVPPPVVNSSGPDCTEASDSLPLDNDCVLHSLNRGLEQLGTAQQHEQQANNS